MRLDTDELVHLVLPTDFIASSSRKIDGKLYQFSNIMEYQYVSMGDMVSLTGYTVKIELVDFYHTETVNNEHIMTLEAEFENCVSERIPEN